MIKNALGLIETIGIVAAIEAADTALKSANVELIGYELTKGQGMVTVKIMGDVSAVKAALNSAKVNAEKVGKVCSVILIARPSEETEKLIRANGPCKKELNKTENNKEDVEKELEETELKDEVCNICKDTLCSRRKGQPRNLCIHYVENNKGDINE